MQFLNEQGRKVKTMCFSYDNYPSVFNERHHKAKKAYRCSECNCWIWPGEIYLHIWGVWEGTASTYRRCERCEKLADAITQVELDEGCGAAEASPGLGNLFNDYHDGDYAEQIKDLSILPSPDPDDVLDKLMIEYDWDNWDLEPVEETGCPVG
jgi:hypothetical protein